MDAVSTAQAQRLAGALRFRTVSLPAAVTPTDADLAPFRELVAFLEREFPLARRALRWERPGDFSLLLSWESPGRASAAPLLFYAHLDVVPPGDGARWTHGPFAGDLADGFAWGRGALDDKSAVLAQLEAVEALLAAGFVPERTVYLAFGSDEETLGLRGAGTIARILADRGVRLAALFDEGMVIADGVIRMVDRPLAMVGCAEKGYADVGIEVRGRAGHASMPGRRTTAGVLAGIIAALERRPFPARLTPTLAAFLRAIAPHARAPLGLLLARPRLFFRMLLAALARSPGTDAIVRTTLAPTILRAGHTTNVLPADARANVNVRLLHGDGVAAARARIERIARRHLPAGFSLEVAVASPDAGEPVPPSAREGPAWRAIVAAVAEVAPRAVVVPSIMVGASDSRRFVGVTDAIYRFRPVVLDEGEMARIHGIDERISLGNYAGMIAYYCGLIRRLAHQESTDG